MRLDPPHCHKLSHLHGPPPLWSVTFFMGQLLINNPIIFRNLYPLISTRFFFSKLRPTYVRSPRSASIIKSLHLNCFSERYLFKTQWFQSYSFRTFDEVILAFLF